MSSVVDVRADTSRSLDRKAEPDEVVREEDITDVARLARLLTRIVVQLAAIRRRFVPKRTTFLNLEVDDSGTTTYRLPHRFGSAVSWSVVGWRSAPAGAFFVEDPTTDDDNLVLVSHVEGTADILVEERG